MGRITYIVFLPKSRGKKIHDGGRGAGVGYKTQTVDPNNFLIQIFLKT
jgi:hypothetical protein